MEDPNAKEENLNALTHGFGVIAGLIGFILLLDQNTHKSPYATVAICIYSTSILLLFTASALYHSISAPRIKYRLRILDHICIYYLIAGTYTPVCLITLVHGNGWVLFFTVWGLATAGTILKFFITGRYEKISLLVYLGMGWLILFDISSLLHTSSLTGLGLLTAGAAFYTIGTFFYANRKIPFNHFIWHLFVLGGALSHWCYIYLDVVGMALNLTSGTQKWSILAL